MCQRFYASQDTMKWPNGAIGHRPGGPFDCLGPYAKVRNCPVDGESRPYTVYATNYADTYFSVPACTRIRGKYVKGILTLSDNGPVFTPQGYSMKDIAQGANNA